MRIIHLKEIIPDKLYQRGQFVTFPWAAKMKMLEEYDIGMVVNLWARPDPELHTKQGLIYIHWPIGGGSPPFNSEAMIDLIESYMCSGTKVLVHCEAGVNRSIWLVSRLLAKHELLPGKEAFDIVKSRAGHTKVRDGLIQDLIST